MPELKAFPTLLIVLCLAACQLGPQTQPVPSVLQIGADLHCPSGDSGYEDQQAGWGFCYPGTWKYSLHSQGTETPIPELDLVFDVTNVPCTTPSAAPGGPSPHPVCSPDVCTTPSAAPGGPTPSPFCPPNAGAFAVMIVSTYQRGTAPDLASWVQANLNPVPTMESIQWGNSVEAARLSDGRRIALTPRQVVILDLHSGAGYLDLESAMSARLGTWKFSV